MKWIDKLKDYAPDIAAAFLTGGATLPQLALKAVSDVVGKDVKDVAALTSVVEQASPETMLLITQANNQFKIRMAELGNELTATELADVQNARETHKHSKMPAIICVVLTIMVSAITMVMFWKAIPEGNASTLYLIIGQVVTLWGGSVIYFIGTTRSSNNKTLLMAGKK